MKTPKILFTILILLLSTTSIFALDIKTRQSLGLDNTLVQQDKVTYTQPTKIYISPISGYQSKLANDPQSWIKLLYYYSITQLKLEDIPYNYLLTEGGEIYEGRYGGVGANSSLLNGENTILIGYMSDKGSFTPRASAALKDFIENLSYEYGIKQASLESVKLNIITSQDSISQLQYEVITTPNLSSIAESITWSNEEHLDYKASIITVDYEKEVVIGEKLPVTVTIKNESEFTWFADTNYIYISTEDNKDSIFAINGVWDSFSKPTHINKSFVKPGEEVEVTFELLAKNKPGEYSQKFVIMKSENNIFANTTFEVKFNITAGDYKLIQIYSPEYGFVNIRECRFYSCEKLEVANDGEVYIMLKEEEGWYQIEFGEKQTGWIYQRYIKQL